MTAPDLTPIRGHLAHVGSPAEAYLVAWAEVADRTPDPERLRAELAGVLAQLEERRRTRRHLGSVPWLTYLRDRIPDDIAAAEERRDLAGWLLLLAQDAEGYVGEEG